MCTAAVRVVDTIADHLNVLKPHNANGVSNIYPAKLAESTRSGREMDPDPAAILAAVADPPTHALLYKGIGMTRMCVYAHNFPS